MLKKPNIAIVGATGLVGKTVLQVLEERDFPFENLYLMASEKSAGKKVVFKGQEYEVEALTEHGFNKDIDIAIFSAGGTLSEKFAPIAVSKGVTVIDNSSAWRMDKNVPLVVPEVNPEDVKWNKGIVANPNCSTIQAVVALKPLQEHYGLKRVVYSTYQAVSGSGVKGIHSLENSLQGNEEDSVYPHPIAGNCLPHIDVFLENGYTKEEMKMINETQKILHDDALRVTATTVRVPVFDAHSESINVELKKQFDVEELKDVLKNSPGIILQDDVLNNVYPLAKSAAGKNEVFVGRIRRDYSENNGINMWVVADNVRKGAATNAVQIAELLIK